MASIAVTPENFEAEVLRSDKPVVVITLPIDYGDESDPSDDSIQFFNTSLEEFKANLQKTVGDQYKIVLVDQRYEGGLNLFTPAPRIFPPPLTFSVFEKGQKLKSGFLMSFSQDSISDSLKQQLSN